MLYSRHLLHWSNSFKVLNPEDSVSKTGWFPCCQHGTVETLGSGIVEKNVSMSQIQQSQ